MPLLTALASYRRIPATCARVRNPSKCRQPPWRLCTTVRRICSIREKRLVRTVGLVAVYKLVRPQVHRLTDPQTLEVLRGVRNPFIRCRLDGITDGRPAGPRHGVRGSLAEYPGR